MSNIQCPGCGAEMKVCTYPDVTIDECHGCGGVFLDRSELSALATGMGGDVEAAVIPQAGSADTHPTRQCPRCAEPMLKVLLLQHSDVVLDHCAQCGGFYLDRGELDAVNTELRHAASGKRSEEFWGVLGGHFVRVDRPSEIRLVLAPDGLDPADGVSEAVTVNYLQVSVFFREPLGVDLWIRRERLSARLAKVLRLFRGTDHVLGDAPFDRAFLVQGTSREAVAAALPSAAREGLVALQARPPCFFTENASVEMFDDRVVYTEGPLYRLEAYPAKRDPGGIIAKLSAIVDAVNGAAQAAEA